MDLVTNPATDLIESLASKVSGRNRARKYQEFIDLLQPRSTDTIIDIGVTDTDYWSTDNYLAKHYPHPERITALTPEKMEHFSRNHPQIKVVNGDGCDLQFADASFDIGYSNAVIEHVGSRERQIQFVREMRRVSKRGYLTTPNRLFPIEVHTRLPLLHLMLSKPQFDRCLEFIGKGWAAGDYMNLLSRSELESVLQTAGVTNYQIRSMRLVGLPLTYTVTWMN
ncbi:class I SAM-dependent methyltransferase [Bradyrhizobium sp. Ce-3]|uniref:class I SAM-dependent methyltransferase n=1 Tax=Bradyrhizobium sp. Ce-3 TaxID=2913970 RepID=UPI001FBBD157|nr:class I SAM-dependent methyltransferase [Bradyrhizobium sp. Ce-3]GKQ50473.1 hypothetical protein BRSPCE3_13280 [Bradyrhizobium sp. Ce-3]